MGDEPSRDADILACRVVLSLLLDRFDEVVCEDSGLGCVTAVNDYEGAVRKSEEKGKNVALILGISGRANV